MLKRAPSRISLFALGMLIWPLAAAATDVDGGPDCGRPTNDWGDAPEGFDAYPGVLAHFPTCFAPSLPGTQDIACAPISTPPGPTGFVVHRNGIPLPGYWFGCGPVGGPSGGIDSEPDGKTSPGLPVSSCADIPVDCMEVTSAGTFGQDECFGDSDAGLEEMPIFAACTPGSIKFRTTNCANGDRVVYLNVLLDMNMDGDWNDNFQCPGSCAYEWAVKNFPLVLPPGCTSHMSPAFLVGPWEGAGWMRISMSDTPVNDSFPWAGCAPAGGGEGFLDLGETEDYFVGEITTGDPCELGYVDFGDAPEDITAYPSGVIGQFPTCLGGGGIGTQDFDPPCPPISTPPGPTGWVMHEKIAGDPIGVWLGCTSLSADFVDSEENGKVNNFAPAGLPSACDPAVLTDCVDLTAGAVFPFGQDECLNDGVDAGLVSATTPVFARCDTASVTFQMYNCSAQEMTVFFNLLVDWNEDGDWNDNLECAQRNVCAPEWALRNTTLVLPPGCSTWTSPKFQVGPKEGYGWMRATLTLDPVNPDFPWAGSASEPQGKFRGGETEDYLILIGESAVGVDVRESDSALEFARIMPNPTSTSAEIRFNLGHTGDVQLAVYDVSGRRVRSLVSGLRGAGAHAVNWDLRNDRGEDVAAGVYFVRLEAEGRALLQRITRLR
ncbi:MAG: FlgD immunoglobulin-like domain containing protein [bacterium]